ncbi:2-amino-4-hydroxy-6-hydroxymethyldihydropteridine diphosphokinase [Dysgonomonas macrotermitis]|uniref:2-amino-4-hydroxy-6-hydroxymethyldihydropteridine pyrophosphokinase n=1 Tax=Dysgonomonas macrotermitis TaxID=1346286 RepID=A0A1M5HIE3_9BACT|nr:2-amino-4-hydroxy-6-hydroxymethyldihydropteridine diphosphokinase [Dysgonomonas macrotermitis]SHG15739.1 2-amino-4-hydroxy-6-hydroxymethyldihydropteridinediphosphokinase [Dysgonomonas macrotermitis]
MQNTDNLHTVYLGLGSNLGDKVGNIMSAVKKIQISIGTVTALSPLYETAPEGFESANTFVNAACAVQTHLTPEEVLEYTQVVERELGRRSKSVNEAYSDRLIDIDILLYDNLIVEMPHLLIPHKYLHERAFALIPLADIAADAVHPILNKTVRELADNIR